MYYADENGLYEYAVAGAVQISEAQYIDAFEHLVSGRILKLHNDSLVLTQKPEKREGFKDAEWRNGAWYYEALPEPEINVYEQWKANRQALVDAIEVEFNGVIFQGDEVSQGRITRAILSLPDDVSTEWTAKDNTVHALTRPDLIAILQIAGSQQTEIWNVGRPIV